MLGSTCDVIMYTDGDIFSLYGIYPINPASYLIKTILMMLLLFPN